MWFFFLSVGRMAGMREVEVLELQRTDGEEFLTIGRSKPLTVRRRKGDVREVVCARVDWAQGKVWGRVVWDSCQSERDEL